MMVECCRKSVVKSIWTAPRQNEKGAPEKRIVHGLITQSANKESMFRVGTRLAEGYFKCGSEIAVDWVNEFVAHLWVDGDWKEVLHVTGLSRPDASEDITWFDLPGQSQACFLEVRRSGIDGWWPCYNLAKTGFLVETSVQEAANEKNTDRLRQSPAQIAPERMIHRVKGDPDEIALSREGITVTRTSMTLRYDTPFYAIGFRLKSAGLAYLGLDGAGAGRTHENMLALGAALVVGDDDDYTQGPVLNPVDGPSACGFLAYRIKGETNIGGNSLTYRMFQEDLDLTTEITFTMKRESLQITLSRHAGKRVKLVDSSAFRLAFNARKTPLTALGSLCDKGETGALRLPLLLHLPGYANIGLDGEGSIQGRYNAIRPKFINTFDFSLGETLCDDGCHLLEKGEYQGSVTLHVGVKHHIALVPETPDVVKTAFGRYFYTCLPFRADTATLSNNGNSMGAPVCMDLWSDLCGLIRKGPFGVDAMACLKSTLEIHLQGAPAYGAGTHSSGNHEYEDEYLMTGTAVLLGISNYLRLIDNQAWYEQFKPQIMKKIRSMKARDLDGDGLVESTLRRGVSGEHQWSTNWYDVISYGYKDAYSNALLYAALRALSCTVAEYGEEDLSLELLDWAYRIKGSYEDVFMTKNGWLAGWRCMEGKLHDFAFLAVNGAAVSAGLLEPERARSIMEKLWKALCGSGFDSFDMGLPGNIISVADSDMADAQRRLPFGGYENGGITLSQSRHFINGLLHVGMEKEADFLLTEICKGLVSGYVIGGVGTGCDWKMWDGVYSGYEGILCDQLGVFQPLIRRFGLDENR